MTTASLPRLATGALLTATALTALAADMTMERALP
jgi:hypothetical protein